MANIVKTQEEWRTAERPAVLDKSLTLLGNEYALWAVRFALLQRHTRIGKSVKHVGNEVGPQDILPGARMYSGGNAAVAGGLLTTFAGGTYFPPLVAVGGVIFVVGLEMREKGYERMSMADRRNRHAEVVVAREEEWRATRLLKEEGLGSVSELVQPNEDCMELNVSDLLAAEEKFSELCRYAELAVVAEGGPSASPQETHNFAREIALAGADQGRLSGATAMSL